MQSADQNGCLQNGKLRPIETLKRGVIDFMDDPAIQLRPDGIVFMPDQTPEKRLKANA